MISPSRGGSGTTTLPPTCSIPTVVTARTSRLFACSTSWPVGHRKFIVLFVDDFTLSLEDETDRPAIEQAVLAKYKITGGELVTRFVGIEFARTTTHTTLTQTAYILSKVLGVAL